MSSVYGMLQGFMQNADLKPQARESVSSAYSPVKAAIAWHSSQLNGFQAVPHSKVPWLCDCSGRAPTPSWLSYCGVTCPRQVPGPHALGHQGRSESCRFQNAAHEFPLEYQFRIPSIISSRSNPDHWKNCRKSPRLNPTKVGDGNSLEILMTCPRAPARQPPLQWRANALSPPRPPCRAPT